MMDPWIGDHLILETTWTEFIEGDILWFSSKVSKKGDEVSNLLLYTPYTVKEVNTNFLTAVAEQASKIVSLYVDCAKETITFSDDRTEAKNTLQLSGLQCLHVPPLETLLVIKNSNWARLCFFKLRTPWASNMILEQEVWLTFARIGTPTSCREPPPFQSLKQLGNWWRHGKNLSFYLGLVTMSWATTNHAGSRSR